MSLILSAAAHGSSSRATPRLIVVGYNFVTPDGRLHLRKGITAFCLPKRAATGQKADAQHFMSWAAAHGLNEFRIFSRVNWTGGGFGVEPGWAYDEDACAWVLDTAASLGCYVQVVAHTYGGDPDECAAHLARVDALCLAHDNALLEAWNEPQFNGGHELVEQVLARYTPQTPGWSVGAYEPTPYTSVAQTGVTAEGKPIYSATATARVGLSMDYHSPRKSEWSRCTKDGKEFGDGTGPSVVFMPGYTCAIAFTEPPQVEQTIRDAGVDDYWPDPAEDWRAYGAGCKFWGCGGTIHSNPDFQQCVVPSDPRVVQCVDAFVAGFSDVPTQRYHGYNRTDPPSSNPGSRAYHRWGDDGREYVLRVRPYSFTKV